MLKYFSKTTSRKKLLHYLSSYLENRKFPLPRFKMSVVKFPSELINRTEEIWSNLGGFP